MGYWFNVFDYMANICISSGSVSIDQSFSSWWSMFSCFFAYLVNFDWMSNIVNFTLLDIRYFCIPINLYELCSRIQTSCYLEIVWPSGTTSFGTVHPFKWFFLWFWVVSSHTCTDQYLADLWGSLCTSLFSYTLSWWL